MKVAAGYCCNNDLRPTIIIDLIENKHLAKTGSALQEIFPASRETSYAKVRKEIYYRSVRDLGIAIFKKNNFAESYEIFRDIYLTEDYSNPLEIIFNQPFSPQLLNILDRNTVLFYLSNLLIYNDLCDQENDLFQDLYLYPQKHFTRSEQLLHFIIINWIKPDFLNNFTDSLAAGSGKSQPGQTAQRLIWHFDYNPENQTAGLYPRIQKMTKAGNWSSGRSAALKTLLQIIGE